MNFYNIKQKMGEKGEGARGWLLTNEKELFYGLLLILVALLAFGLGRLSKIEEAKVPMRIENATTSLEVVNTASSNTAVSENTAGVVVDNKMPEYQIGSVIVSSRGKKYHFPWCPGAKTIKASNRIVLTEAEAKAKGYTLASGCSSVSGE
ncbi:MAG: hypothetical protein NTV48_02520 [Candidatus Vogelbacteria bacterium]|nr:hypothetical protein [Candidatus Vogelbacteria bacterium]